MLGRLAFAVAFLLLPLAAAQGPMHQGAIEGDADASAAEAGAARVAEVLRAIFQQGSADLPSQSDLVQGAYHPLGDADGDGLDDVLFVYGALRPGEGFETDGGAIALAGPDAARSLWSVRSERAYGWVPDLDGDGLHDVAASPAAGDGTAQVTGVLVGSAGTYAFSSAAPVEVLSGRDLAPVGAMADGYAYDAAQASLAPVAAYAFAQQSASASEFSSVLAPGLVFSVQRRIQEVASYGSTPATSAYTWAEDADATFRLADAKGAILVEHAVQGPHLDPWDGVAGWFDGGAPALVVTWAESPPAVYTTGAPSPGRMPLHLHLAMASAEGVQWQIDREPGQREQGLLMALGDIDGDGSDDVAYTELSQDTVGMRVTATTLLLSGADGSVLHEDPASEMAHLYIPFGDIDGDGRQDLLRAEIDFAGTSVAWSIARGPTGEVAWSPAVSGEVYPVNLDVDDGPISAHDMTGDGVPDLVLHGAMTGLQAFDGRDGTLLWQLDRPDLLDASPLGDLTFDGGSDLLVFLGEGVSGDFGDEPDADATLGFQVLAGADGQVVWDQVLRSPATVPVDSEGLVYLDGHGVGDLDGDRRQDFTVRIVQERTFERSFEGGSFTYRFLQPSPYLFSTAAGLPLDGASGTAGGAGVPGEGSGLPPPGTAPSPTASSAAQEKGSPGLPVLLGLAVLAAVAASRRR